jgi:hypothetical protein
MTPREIAVTLTEAQVRALRDPTMCKRSDWLKLCRFDVENGTRLLGCGGISEVNRRAVLAVLDGEALK